jgi:hypothetical protein
MPFFNIAIFPFNIAIPLFKVTNSLFWLSLPYAHIAYLRLKVRYEIPEFRCQARRVTHITKPVWHEQQD